MKHARYPIALLLILSLAGCGLFRPGPTPATPQHRLDSAKTFYASTLRIVNLLINAGYIAKNDQELKNLIFAASEKTNAAFVRAQELLDAGQPIDAGFWIDQGLASLEILLMHQAEGEAKHGASNPATRPALPGPNVQ